MYQRMKVMDTWSEISLGLRHHADANMMLKRLANSADVAPLQTLSNYIEPAQYYARHWEKWISTPNKGDLYNKYERLNRFADALPMESLTVYEMNDLVEAFAKGDTIAPDKLALHYQTAKLAAQQAKPIFAANVASVDTVVVSDATVRVSELALTLIEAAKQGQKLRVSDVAEYQRIIDDNAIILDETIVAIVKPTEMLLHKLAN
jgi:hexosaminidase